MLHGAKVMSVREYFFSWIESLFRRIFLFFFLDKKEASRKNRDLRQKAFGVYDEKIPSSTYPKFRQLGDNNGSNIIDFLTAMHQIF